LSNFAAAPSTADDTAAASPPHRRQKQQPSTYTYDSERSDDDEDEDDEDSFTMDTNHTKPAPKKSSARKQSPPSDPLTAEFSKIRISSKTVVSPPFGFTALFPYLVKTTNILSDGRKKYIIEMVVFPLHANHYRVVVGNDNKSIQVSVRILDELLSNQRIQDTIAATAGAEQEMARSNLQGHHEVMRTVRNVYPGNQEIWSQPPQIITFDNTVENIVASKSIDWLPGCYDLVEEFHNAANILPPQQALLT